MDIYVYLQYFVLGMYICAHGLKKVLSSYPGQVHVDFSPWASNFSFSMDKGPGKSSAN